ncbi:MAG: molybdenum cofactor biosynthesis protein MoeB [Acidobacteria bacterium]|nr:MAG: molybdenum cofactor biosynthesis protein MoeB [Acidobacteriota bacterium]
MPVTVHIPTPLRPYAGASREVRVEGRTLGEVLAALTERYPDLRRHLYTPEGKLRSFVNIYVNDSDARYLKREETELADSDEIRIIPSIAGGSAVAPAAAPALSATEILRYSRHLIMPEVGMEGQLKLKAARVLAIGAGGLGSPLSLYLAAAGIGKLGIVDFDVVDLTNLQRQVLHSTDAVGKPKLDSARARLEALNPEVEVKLYETRLTSENALDIFKDYDIVVDGTDNFPTRYLVNDACVLLGKPNVYGSIFRFEGQASVFGAPGGPCYRCLYPEPPPPGLVPSCAEGGVLGILPGTIGLIQATEAVKLILGIGEPLVGRLLLFDALRMSFRELRLRKDPDCPICGEHPTIHALIDYNQFCGVTAQLEPALPSDWEIDPVELKARLDRNEPLYLLDVREPHEWQICRIPQAHLIPLGELPARMNQLSTADNIVAYCRSGVRSGKAVDLLRKTGFTRIKNLKGGILAWSDKVDPSVPKY